MLEWVRFGDGRYFMKLKHALLGSFLCSVFLSAGAQAGIDYARVATELDLLAGRLQGHPAYDLGFLERLRGISARTLNVAGSSRRDDVNFVEGHFGKSTEGLDRLTAIREFRSRIKNDHQLILIQSSLSVPPIARLDTSVQNALEREWKDIQNDHEPRAWDGIDQHDRTPIYCREICGCIAGRFWDAVKRVEPKRSPVILQASFDPKRAGNGVGDLQVADNQGTWVSYAYGFHFVTLIDDEGGNWALIDPMTFGDVRPHAIAEWLPHLRNWKNLNYSPAIPLPESEQSEPSLLESLKALWEDLRS